RNVPLQQVYDVAQRVLRQCALRMPLEFALASGNFVTLELPAATADQAILFAERLGTELGVDARFVTVRANTFRDYFIDQIYLERPDRRRFGVTGVPASTPVKDLARGLRTSQYQEADWPQDRSGKPRDAVVDKIDDQGNAKRLDPAKSLHENDVRNEDTLH